MPLASTSVTCVHVPARRGVRAPRLVARADPAGWRGMSSSCSASSPELSSKLSARSLVARADPAGWRGMSSMSAMTCVHVAARRVERVRALRLVVRPCGVGGDGDVFLAGLGELARAFLAALGVLARALNRIARRPFGRGRVGLSLPIPLFTFIDALDRCCLYGRLGWGWSFGLLLAGLPIFLAFLDSPGSWNLLDLGLGLGR